jgi:hypothetical protein
MTFLLEMREKLRNFYGKYEIYVAVAVKFILGIVVFLWINSGIGYLERLNQLAVVLLLALLCAFLPIGVMVAAACAAAFFGAVAGGLRHLAGIGAAAVFPVLEVCAWAWIQRPFNAAALFFAGAAGNASGNGAFGGAVFLFFRPERRGSFLLRAGHPGEYCSLYVRGGGRGLFQAFVSLEAIGRE